MTDADPRVLEAAARETWAEGLRGLDDDFVATAQQQLRDAGMVFGGRDAVTVARPMLIAQETVDSDDRTVAAVIAALSAAADLVLADDAVGQACMPEWFDGGDLDRLLRLDPGYSMPVVFGRFDGTRRDGRLLILEFNGGIPGGVLPTDGSSAVMAAWPPADLLRERFKVSHPVVADALMDAAIGAWYEFGGTGRPFVVVAVPQELADLTRGGIAHLAAAAERAGVRLESADPAECVHLDGRLRYRDEPVDVLVRAFYTIMLPQLGERVRGIVAALEAGDLCMVTSFRSGLLGHKALFALVTDPQIDLGLPEEVMAVARAALPWTRLVRPGPTTDPEGAGVDLVEYARGNREQLVLKPGEGYAGRGVMLGWDVDDVMWREGLDGAQSGESWILQERLPMLEASFPGLAPGFPDRSFTADVNPLIAAGHVAGYFVRVAHGGMTNLTGSDATTTGSLVIAPREAG